MTGLTLHPHSQEELLAGEALHRVLKEERIAGDAASVACALLPEGSAPGPAEVVSTCHRGLVSRLTRAGVQ